MELHAELERIIADPALTDAVAQLLQKHVAAAHAIVARRDTELHAARTKIQALTLELAHLKRMRYGVRSEALDTEGIGAHRRSLRDRVPR